MAIYKNREVTVVGPNSSANTAETIQVRYKDGTHENVSTSLVGFTDDEKKQLIKNYPSRFENVRTVAQADVDAVRVGVTPPSDPSYQTMAEVQVQHQKQTELTQKHSEAAKKEAEKNFANKSEPKPTPTAVTTKPSWVK